MSWATLGIKFLKCVKHFFFLRKKKEEGKEWMEGGKKEGGEKGRKVGKRRETARFFQLVHHLITPLGQMMPSLWS